MKVLIGVDTHKASVTVVGCSRKVDGGGVSEQVWWRDLPLRRPIATIPSKLSGKLESMEVSIASPYAPGRPTLEEGEPR
jgi:hypothetical protein